MLRSRKLIFCFARTIFSPRLRVSRIERHACRCDVLTLNSASLEDGESVLTGKGDIGKHRSYRQSQRPTVRLRCELCLVQDVVSVVATANCLRPDNAAGCASFLEENARTSLACRLLEMGEVRCDNGGLAAPRLSIQMKLARLIKVRGLLVRSRPRRTPALRALSASDQTIDLAGVNLQLKRGHLMPGDAGPMVSKLTADDRPVFAHRWMLRASDFGPHQFIRCVCPRHSQAANSSASGACRCRLSAPPGRSVAYLKFTSAIGVSRGPMFASASAARLVGRWMRAHRQVAASWTGALAFF